jgi:hypothetical protein
LIKSEGPVVVEGRRWVDDRSETADYAP